MQAVTVIVPLIANGTAVGSATVAAELRSGATTAAGGAVAVKGAIVNQISVDDNALKTAPPWPDATGSAAAEWLRVSPAIAASGHIATRDSIKRASVQRQSAGIVDAASLA